MLVKCSDGTVDHYEDDPFASGGQGLLYLSRDKRSVIKLYHDAGTTRVAALNKIIGDLNVTRHEPTSSHLFAWPNAIVQSPRLGVRMSNVNVQLEHKPLTWWIGARAYKRLPETIR